MDRIAAKKGGGVMAAVSEQPEYMTPAEVRDAFQVTPETVRRWGRAGQLTSVQTLGGHRRYLASEVRALLAAPGDTPQPQPQPQPGGDALDPADVAGLAEEIRADMTRMGSGITVTQASAMVARTAMRWMQDKQRRENGNG
jgi:hypothetical protein